MELEKVKKIRFNIDRGGTFTDIFAEIIENGQSVGFRVLKVLSEDPTNTYDNAPREGIRQILNEVLGLTIGIKERLPTAHIDWIRMGTTVATNALLERNSGKQKSAALPAPSKVALVTTQGFRDLLTIGNQSRPNIFDLKCVKPELLVEQAYTIEVDERVRVRTDIAANDVSGDDKQFRVYPNGEVVEVERALPEPGSPEYEELIRRLKIPLANGVTSIAVLCLHSYIFDEHEKQIGAICKDLGYKYIALSSALSKSVKAVARGHTATVDAFLTPFLEAYIQGFLAGFEDSIGEVDVSFMKSDGGLCPVQDFTGYVSIISGPAGGVVGFSHTQTVFQESHEKCIPFVGFDMGGTSTDVARVEGDNFQFVYETQLDGVFIQATQLDINTVAAGGGSVLHVKDGYMTVGPDSVGSDPGPVCYGKGSKKLAVSDANFFLGRIVSDYFPFPLNYDKTLNAFCQVTEQLNDAHPTEVMSPEEVAFSFLKIANDKMAEAVKKVTEARGYDVKEHILNVFGGAGPQHACAMARSLGIERVVINRFSSVLSALGLGLADEKEEIVFPCKVNYVYSQDILAEIQATITNLSNQVRESLHVKRKFPHERIVVKASLNMRYQGTDTNIAVVQNPDKDFKSQFEAQYYREFGFIVEGGQIVVESISVVGFGKSPKVHQQTIHRSSTKSKPVRSTQCYFHDPEQSKGTFLETPIYILSDMNVGDVILGPSLIIDPKYFITLVLEPSCVATLTPYGHVEVTVPRQKHSPETALLKRSLFIHRFMSIAEQMGVSLQRTSKSVNIKERLDFSCALFSHTGGLVANAPHLPVHLGSMQFAVKYQINNAVDWKKGEVILTNHPAAGGSHLPDFTVITPVYYEGDASAEVIVKGAKIDLTRPIFYVASRAHHAEIGGITPGSMPSFSRLLAEEGAATKSLKIAVDGAFQTQAVLDFLAEPGNNKTPFEVQPKGSRKPEDNLADLKAQMAANTRGIDLIHGLVQNYSVCEVLEMMLEVQEAAEVAVRKKLMAVAKQQQARAAEISPPSDLSSPSESTSASVSTNHGPNIVSSPSESTSASVSTNHGPNIVVLKASDMMDTGSRIKLRITIDASTGDAVFDFTGTSLETFSNINAPISVTHSAVIYSLRCLVDDDIPLNEGCVIPIKIIIPPNSLLSPSDSAAVVGGNVLTSQRVTDVVLYAFGAQACSQGCMNNFSFGGENMLSYYETIAGGCGAGPTWHGQSAVQSHMTNTRITDPEILERRFPVKLLEFSIREGSGGKGQFRGGDGVVRRIQFLQPMVMSILSERRVLAPRGLAGGNDGQRGENFYYQNVNTAYQKKISLGGKNTIPVNAGDVFEVRTPGGGGYGPTERSGTQ